MPCVAAKLLEVRVVVQGQQPKKLREGFYLLRDALPRPQLGEHAHSHTEHGGPATAIRQANQPVSASVIYSTAIDQRGATQFSLPI